MVKADHITQPTLFGGVVPGIFALFAWQVDNPQITGQGAGMVTQSGLVNFNISWSNGTDGAYQGAFDEQGHLNGSTFDLKNPGTFAGWHTDQTFPM
jgi:hypothetical protein